MGICDDRKVCAERSNNGNRAVTACGDLPAHPVAQIETWRFRGERVF